jgi:hypothetical protein
MMKQPSMELLLGPTMADVLSDEDETMSESLIDGDDECFDFFLEPSEKNKRKDTERRDRRSAGRVGFDCFDDEDKEDSPILDYSSSSDDNWISIEGGMEELVDDIVSFPDSSFYGHSEDNDVFSLPFTERFESTVLKLSESMRRSSETRKSLVIKTSPAVINTPQSVNEVILRVEESTRFIQTSLCRPAKTRKVSVSVVSV